MTIHEHTTIALYDDGGEQIGNYTMGEEEFRLLDGKHSVAFNVTEAADLIAFLQRVRGMQKPKPAPEPAKPTPSVWLPNCKPGDVCVRRDGVRLNYEGPSSSTQFPHRAGDSTFTDNGAWSLKGRPHYLDIVAVIPSDHSGPSGTACDTLAKEYAR
jgi:hypothetical protein